MVNKRFILPTWELVGGESKRMTVTMWDDDGELYNIPNSTVELTVVDFINSDSTPLIKKTGSGAAEICQGQSGEWCDCVLTLVPSDTQSLCGKYIYQAKITDRSGNVACPQGIMLIRDNTK